MNKPSEFRRPESVLVVVHTPALECGLAFFGADRVRFGTDMPFDPEQGPGFIRDTIGAMDAARMSAEDRVKIYEGNARRLLRLRG